MEKVYVVYYDNGLSYEDYQLSTVGIYSSLESANKFVAESKANNVFRCEFTKEEYYKQDPDDIHKTYEQYYEDELYMWEYFNRGHCFVKEYPVLP